MTFRRAFVIVATLAFAAGWVMDVSIRRAVGTIGRTER